MARLNPDVIEFQVVYQWAGWHREDHVLRYTARITGNTTKSGAWAVHMAALTPALEPGLRTKGELMKLARFLKDCLEDRKSVVIGMTMDKIA